MQIIVPTLQHYVVFQFEATTSECCFLNPHDWHIKKMLKMMLKQLCCILQQNYESNLLQDMLYTTYSNYDTQIIHFPKVLYLSLVCSLKNLNIAIISVFSCGFWIFWFLFYTSKEFLQFVWSIHHHSWKEIVNTPDLTGHLRSCLLGFPEVSEVSLVMQTSLTHLFHCSNMVKE